MISYIVIFSVLCIIIGIGDQVSLSCLPSMGQKNDHVETTFIVSPHKIRIDIAAFFQNGGKCIHYVVPVIPIYGFKSHDALEKKWLDT